MKLHLPASYIPRTEPRYDDDIARIRAGVVWQPDVYAEAASAAQAVNAGLLIDVGCGNCAKLLPFADDFDLIGLDQVRTIERLDVAFPTFAVDLETVTADVVDDVTGGWIICSDVIEHLVDPEPLLTTIRAWLDDGAVGVTLSTPDRVRLYRGGRPGGLGPPHNPAHVREWALPELVAMLADAGIRATTATHTRSNDRTGKMTTCLVHGS